MDYSPLHRQIFSLPKLVESLVASLSPIAENLVSNLNFAQIQQIILTGCGDSYHAALNAQLAFEQLAGISCSSQPAMQFSRYSAPFMIGREKGSTIVIGISVSGQVTRTIEALDLGRQAGAVTVAVTGKKESPLGKVSDHVLQTAVPPFPDQRQIVPGSRSYYASQLALYLIAIYLGRKRNNLSKIEFEDQISALQQLANPIQETIELCDPITLQAAKSWAGQKIFVFCGSGPNFGTASFCAAKILEATGDDALAQDVEEWAHLQYFAKEKKTPTLIISAGDKDIDRVEEIITAASAIGRQIALIAPHNSDIAKSEAVNYLFPIAGSVKEYFSPLVTALPGLLFSSHLAQILNEPYFRDFKGGRSAAGGGGISRIRTSHRLKTLPSHTNSQPVEFITIGGLRADYLITREGKAYNGLPGGNALFSAVGAALWTSKIAPLARYGQNFPSSWLSNLSELGLNTKALVSIPGEQDHRTFFAYTPEGIRDDTKPEVHYSRIGQTMPEALQGYIHSTPHQAEAEHFEPLAVRPSDWPQQTGHVSAVHLAPLPLATHLHLPAKLRENNVRLITLDPGERYMVPERLAQVKEILPMIDVFLPSDMEVYSLLGKQISLWQAAQQFTEWGASLVVIKIGAQGVLVYDQKKGRTHLPAYHQPGDKRVVDVTGAGDAFCGGFFVGLSKNADPILAAQMGLVSASMVVEGYGALYALSLNKNLAQKRLSQIRSR